MLVCMQEAKKEFKLPLTQIVVPVNTQQLFGTIVIRLEASLFSLPPKRMLFIEL